VTGELEPTRVRDLLGLCAIAAVASWILVRVFYGDLPPIPVYAGASLYPVAVVEVVAAFLIRARISEHRIGAGPHQLHPIAAARAVALAKASALLGAAVAGIWLGFALYVLPQRGVLSAAVHDTPGAMVGLVGAVALAAAALWLEHCCRAPEDPSDRSTP
jgi:Protein of unknown function (DUF3180)